MRRAAGKTAYAAMSELTAGLPVALLNQPHCAMAMG
jgi:hypothetical protein